MGDSSAQGKTTKEWGEMGVSNRRLAWEGRKFFRVLLEDDAGNPNGVTSTGGQIIYAA
jgi:hypothetical protein